MEQIDERAPAEYIEEMALLEGKATREQMKLLTTSFGEMQFDRRRWLIAPAVDCVKRRDEVHLTEALNTVMIYAEGYGIIQSCGYLSDMEMKTLPALFNANKYSDVRDVIDAADVECEDQFFAKLTKLLAKAENCAPFAVHHVSGETNISGSEVGQEPTKIQHTKRADDTDNNTGDSDEILCTAKATVDELVSALRNRIANYADSIECERHYERSIGSISPRRLLELLIPAAAAARNGMEQEFRAEIRCLADRGDDMKLIVHNKSLNQEESTLLARYYYKMDYTMVGYLLVSSMKSGNVVFREVLLDFCRRTEIAEAGIDVIRKYAGAKQARSIMQCTRSVPVESLGRLVYRLVAAAKHGDSVQFAERLGALRNWSELVQLVEQAGYLDAQTKTVLDWVCCEVSSEDVRALKTLAVNCRGKRAFDEMLCRVRNDIDANCASIRNEDRHNRILHLRQLRESAKLTMKSIHENKTTARSETFRDLIDIMGCISRKHRSDRKEMPVEWINVLNAFNCMMSDLKSNGFCYEDMDDLTVNAVYGSILNYLLDYLWEIGSEEQHHRFLEHMFVYDRLTDKIRENGRVGAHLPPVNIYVAESPSFDDADPCLAVHTTLIVHVRGVCTTDDIKSKLQSALSRDRYFMSFDEAMS